MHSVSSTELAEWLDYNLGTILDFRNSGELDGNFVGSELRHTEDEAIAFLAKLTPRNTTETLTLDHFRRGVRLLRLVAASKKLGRSAVGLRWQVLHGGLRAYSMHVYKRHGQWRFIQSDIEVIAAYLKRSIAQRQGEHVLGVGKFVFKRYMTDGWIEPLVVTEDYLSKLGILHHRHTRASLVATVARLLVPYAAANAEAWVAEMLENDTPPFTSTETLRQLGIAHRSELQQLVSAHNLPFLGLGGAGNGDRRYLPSSVRKLFLAQEPLDPAETAATLCWEPHAVTDWLTEACSLHDHSQGLEHRHACLVAALAPLLSERFSPPRFLQSRNRSRSPLVGVEIAAQHLQAPVEDVVFAVQTGILPGIRRPDGVWLLLPTPLKAMDEQTFALSLLMQRTRLKGP